MNKYTEWQIKRMQALVGGTITGTVFSPEDDFGDEFFGLRVQVVNTTYAVFILRDDEGNGPGSLEISKI